MVRRILPDSDFESDDDNLLVTSFRQSEYVHPSSPVSKSNASPSPTSSTPSKAHPQSTRRVVRSSAVNPKPVGTYDYDSDIYTEESSMGSFIVRTDSESEDDIGGKHDSGTAVHPLSNCHVGKESDKVSRFLSPQASLSQPVTSSPRLVGPPPEDFLSKAILVQCSQS